MANLQQAIRQTVDQMYLVLENIDHLLVDIDTELSRIDYEVLHGTGIQCDTTKQNSTGLFPYQVSMYYRAKAVDDVPSRNTLGVGVILTDSSFKAIDPLLVGAVFQTKSGAPYTAWWTHAAAVGTDPANEVQNSRFPVNIMRTIAGQKGKAWYEQALFFTMPLTEVDSVVTLSKSFLLPLHELYRSAEQYFLPLQP